MRHPIAEIINDSIINEECDDEYYRLLYVPCYFYKPSKNIKCDLCKTNLNTTIATIEHITLYICVVCIDRI
jgi:hypothetical protein